MTRKKTVTLGVRAAEVKATLRTLAVGNALPKSWPAANPSTRKIADLIPAARNARLHSPAQLMQIRISIEQFGWTIPVLVEAETGEIIAGHGRVLVAADLGIEIIPVLEARGWTEAMKRAYALADNKLPENATWDLGVLRAEFAALETFGFDLTWTGFSLGEIANVALERRLGENDPLAEWRGMPEFDSKDKTAFRTIPVHFKDQAAVDAFAKAVGLPITERTRYLWFPEIEIETLADKRYAQVDAGVPDLHSEQGPGGKPPDDQGPNGDGRPV